MVTLSPMEPNLEETSWCTWGTLPSTTRDTLWSAEKMLWKKIGEEESKTLWLFVGSSLKRNICIIWFVLFIKRWTCAAPLAKFSGLILFSLFSIWYSLLVFCVQIGLNCKEDCSPVLDGGGGGQVQEFKERTIEQQSVICMYQYWKRNKWDWSWLKQTAKTRGKCGPGPWNRFWSYRRFWVHLVLPKSA